MDWVLVDKRLKGRLEDVNVLNSWGCVIGSDHFLVVARVCWGRTRCEK
jgi:endonuclease/exonuclease/phosphatase family metal-dependent hydrolase